MSDKLIVNPYAEGNIPCTNQAPLRTLAQNRALYLMFKQLAQLLNEHGIDYTKLVIKADIPFNQNLVKELIWKPVQEAFCGTDSTTKLTTKDIDAIFQIITKSVGEIIGEQISWPSVEALFKKDLLNK